MQQHLPKEASWLRTFIGEFLKMGRKSHTYVHICSCSHFIKYSIHIYIYLYNLCHSWEEACSIQTAGFFKNAGKHSTTCV